jgi:hypothetical protein
MLKMEITSKMTHALPIKPPEGDNKGKIEKVQIYFV